MNCMGGALPASRSPIGLVTLLGLHLPCFRSSTERHGSQAMHGSTHVHGHTVERQITLPNLSYPQSDALNARVQGCETLKNKAHTKEKQCAAEACGHPYG